MTYCSFSFFVGTCYYVLNPHLGNDDLTLAPPPPAISNCWDTSHIPGGCRTSLPVPCNLVPDIRATNVLQIDPKVLVLCLYFVLCFFIDPLGYVCETRRHSTVIKGCFLPTWTANYVLSVGLQFFNHAPLRHSHCLVQCSHSHFLCGVMQMPYVFCVPRCSSFTSSKLGKYGYTGNTVPTSNK